MLQEIALGDITIMAVIRIVQCTNTAGDLIQIVIKLFTTIIISL